MKVEIEDGRLIVTPITEEDSRIIYALAAAYAAFDAVCYPIMGEAVRCTDDAFTDFCHPGTVPDLLPPAVW